MNLTFRIQSLSESMLLTRVVFSVFSWWQHSENLASYEQQDAHEFFISMLDRIHEKLGKSSIANRGKIWHFLFL